MAGYVVLNPSLAAVTPGESVAITVQVRNTSSVVDQFAIGVLGEAASWATVSPPVLSLFPGAEGSTQVIFTPPRTADVPAGVVTYGIRVVPHEDPDGSSVEEAQLDIAGFAAVTARVTPRNSEGKRTAVHTVFISNGGNTDVEAEVEATDPDEAMAFDIRPPAMTIPPGGEGTATVKVATREKLAQPTPRPFQIIVRPGTEPPVVLDATMTQTKGRGVPRFVPALVIGAIAIALAAMILPGMLKKDPETAAADLAAAGGPTTLPTAVTPPPQEAPTGEEAGGAPAATPPPTRPPTTPPPATAPVVVAPSPSSPRVFFSSNRSGGQQLFSANPDASDLKQLTTDGINVQPHSPRDQSRITFASHPSDRLKVKIFAMNPDGSGKQQLTSQPAASRDETPRFSPDGSKIVFISNRDDRSFDIFVMNADGSGQTNLTNSAGVTDLWPTWSADGKRLAWHRGGGAPGETWVMNADGSNQQNLVAGSQPSWSPTNASLLVYVAGIGNSSEIKLMDVARPNDPHVRLTNNSARDDQPMWLSNGSGISFRTFRDGNEEVYFMDGGGGNQTNVSKNPGVDNVTS
ncbi:MAG: hypothetical protein ACR2H3_13730 [Acidimicrobiales bacterium]